MKSNIDSRRTSSQLIVGLLVIGLGVLFLLDNLDIIDFHRAITFWPVAFIVAGVLKLLDTRSPNGYLFGSALIGVGVIMILNRTGLFYINWRTIWPLLLIAVGGSVLYRALKDKERRPQAAMLAPEQGDDASDQVIDVTAILAGFERRISSRRFRGGEVTAIMGGCNLDLRDASIEGEAVLNVFAMWGGITLRCPPDWTVVLQGTPIMGGFEEKTATPPDSAKRLVIRGYAIMGGVEVRN
jgi:predicted membrane protein